MDARPDDDADDDDRGATSPPVEPPAGAADGDPRPHEQVPGPSGDDEVWASIVARLSDVDGGNDPALLDALGVEQPDAPVPAPPPGAGPALTGRDWDGTSQYDAAEDDVDDLEHFEPQDPGPITAGDPLLTLAWVAAVGAPLFLLVVVTLWRDAPSLLVRAAAVVFVVGVGVLVWRMPQHREPTDGDGAVV